MIAGSADSMPVTVVQAGLVITAQIRLGRFQPFPW
jgi:hypothetical protein